MGLCLYILLGVPKKEFLDVPACRLSCKNKAIKYMPFVKLFTLLARSRQGTGDPSGRVHLLSKSFFHLEGRMQRAMYYYNRQLLFDYTNSISGKLPVCLHHIIRSYALEFLEIWTCLSFFNSLPPELLSVLGPLER